jgi:hypothetical protein
VYVHIQKSTTNNKKNGEESDIDDDMKLPLPLTTFAKALDGLQVTNIFVNNKKFQARY